MDIKWTIFQSYVSFLEGIVSYMCFSCAVQCSNHVVLCCSHLSPEIPKHPKKVLNFSRWFAILIAHLYFSDHWWANCLGVFRGIASAFPRHCPATSDREVRFRRAGPAGPERGQHGTSAGGSGGLGECMGNPLVFPMDFLDFWLQGSRMI